MGALTIGKLADAAGVNVETLRYYERRGLLPEPPRNASGYRQYSTDHLRRLQLIGRAKELGFTLAEIADLLDRDDGDPSDRIVQAARAKLDAIDQRGRELVALRDRLERLMVVCGDVGGSDDCLALRVTG